MCHLGEYFYFQLGCIKAFAFGFGPETALLLVIDHFLLTVNDVVLSQLVNKDGTWVRLSAESAQTYSEGSAGVAWCLQYHGHLDRTMLLPVDDDDTQVPTCGEGS